MFYTEYAVEQTMQMSVIKGAMSLMWRHFNTIGMFQMEFSCPASDCENIFPTFGTAIEHHVVNHPNENIKIKRRELSAETGGFWSLCYNIIPSESDVKLMRKGKSLKSGKTKRNLTTLHINVTPMKSNAGLAAQCLSFFFIKTRPRT